MNVVLPRLTYPGILPLIRHQYDITIEKMAPVGIAAIFPALGRSRLLGVAIQPVFNDVMVELLAPK